MIKGKRGIAFFTAFSLLLTVFMGFTVKADEKQESHTLTIRCGEYGDYQVAGMENNDSNQYKIDKGKKVKVQFSPNEGYRLAGITFAKSDLTNDNGKVTFTMPDNDVDLSAMFLGDKESPAEEGIINPLYDGETAPNIFSVASENKAETYDMVGDTWCAVHNEGNPIPIDRKAVLDWLGQHINDNYYFGTPYRGMDCRNPNGDCAGAYGNDDVPGVANMNCTGYVWHVIKAATGYEVPAVSGWVTFLRNNHFEYMTFSGSDMNAILQSMISSDYIEPGDIIWSWDTGAGSLDGDDLMSALSANHHVGIYVGEYFDKENTANIQWQPNTGKNRWFHCSDHGAGSTGLTGCQSSQIMPKTPSAAFTIIKLRGKLEGKIEVHKKSSNPELTENNPCYSLAGAEFTVYRPGTDDVVTKIVTDSAGYGSATVLPGDYEIAETKAPKGFALNGNGKRDAIIVNPNATATYEKVDNAQGDPVSIILKKKDAENDTDKPQGNSLLNGAQFTIKYYKEFYDTNPEGQGKIPERSWIIQTGKEGYCNLSEKYKVGGDDFYLNSMGKPYFPLGTITLQETKAPDGYLINPDVFVRKVLPNSGTESVDTYNAPTVPETVIRGGVAVKKLDNETNSGVPQGNASLAGAKIQIVSNNDSPVKVNGKIYQKGQMVALLTTNDKGEAQTAANLLPYGDYILKEQSPPNGYQMAGVIQRRFSIRENGVLVQMTTPDTAIKDNVIRGGVKIQKWDNETNQGKPQGNATLKGAEFELSSLNANPVMVEGKKFERNQVIATFKTDAQGFVQTPGNYLPYGKYKFRETKPPEGYNHTGTLEREFEIRDNGAIVQLTTSSGAIKNNIIRGDLQLVKFRESQDQDQDQKVPLEGIKFTITSKTTGEKHVITTDKYGYASTKQLGISDRGNLVHDVYTVHESNTPPGLKPVKDFEITIKNEGETLYYILEDKLVLSPVKLLKVDKTTGKRIPLADTEFQLLDKDKKPVIMKTHYPSETIHYTYKTDAGGSLTLPEKLPAGVYYWREINSPQGYLLNGQDLKFEITQGHDWEEPFIVEFDNMPTMGKIAIKKTDKETKDPLAGAVFEVKAKEDIVTPDQTVRAKKGETVDTITSQKNGTAETKKLYLGKYQVQETKPSPGYALSSKKYDVELKYKDQSQEIVTAGLDVTNAPTKIIIEKVDGKTKKPLLGAAFEVWNKADNPDSVDSEMAVKQRYVTDGKGNIELARLLPGTYCLQEAEPPIGYAGDQKLHEFTIDKDGMVKGKSTFTMQIENDKSQIIGTKATDRDTGKGQAIAKEKTILVDEVSYQNLIPGQEYTLKGILMDKSTGKPLLSKGKEIRAEKTFKPLKAEGIEKVEYSFDSRDLAGKEAVVFEELYTKGTLISAHEDLNDLGQTVKFPKHEIGTKAQDKDTETGQAIAQEKTVIADQVSYKSLIPGEEYTLRGVLMDKSTGKPLLSEGKEIRAEKTFKPQKAEGTQEMEFTFKSLDFSGKETVVFEKLYCQDAQVAAHADIKDKGQTVEFPKHEISTSATDRYTGTRQGITREKAAIVDQVTYKGLIPGEEYTLKGILMDKSTGKPLLSEGKEVRAQKTFKPQKPEGVEQVVFTFDSRELNDRETVVFEKLYAHKTVVAAHEDIKDKAQTVNIKLGRLTVTMPGNRGSGVKTGDVNNSIKTLIALLLLSGGAVTALTIYKKRKKGGKTEDDKE